MAMIRVPTLRRPGRSEGQTATPDATVATDGDARRSGPDAASASYVWLCILVGAALSIAIAVGVGFERTGVTQGAASCVAGAVAFGVALLPLMVTWALLHSGKG